jgi:hypothetical protein
MSNSAARTDADRMTLIASMCDLVPTDADDTDRACARGAIVTDHHPILQMLNPSKAKGMAFALALNVFPSATPETVIDAIQAYLASEPVYSDVYVILNGYAKSEVARAFAHAWFPQSHPA